MKILSIETSCDETAISILEAEGSFDDKNNPIKFQILADNLISQIDLHKQYGGVFPALAKREHSKNLIPILCKTLTEANLRNPVSQFCFGEGFDLRNPVSQILKISPKINKILEREPELLKLFLEYIPTIEIPEIDAIAVTQGPGLEPALWVGINFAKALSLVWNKPLIPVNHMEGHLLASLISPKSKVQSQKIENIEFPAIGLLISGGHTELILMKGGMQYEKIGQTLDDAVGEAFDKVARMMDLPYPGGPEISKLAQTNREKLRNPVSQEIKLPRPMLYTDDFNFSFSGLKTAVLYLIKNLKKEMKNKSLDRFATAREDTGHASPTGRLLRRKFSSQSRHTHKDNTVSASEAKQSRNQVTETEIELPIEIKQEIAQEFEDAVVEVLLKKTQKAVKEFGAQTLILGGGVVANSQIRQAFQSLGNPITKLKVLMPEREFSTDNAIMIGIAGYFQYLKQDPKPMVGQKKKGQVPKALDHYDNIKADGNLQI